MGLDQYLYAKKYYSPSSWLGEEVTGAYEKITDALDIADFIYENHPACQVEVKVAQWRKANAIHQWFVDSCQDGVDDCRESYCNRQKLTALKDLCIRVTDNPEMAEDLLPAQAGFFFGETDYNEWYYSELKNTAEELTKLLTMPDEWEFYYHSSW